jgi:hypothetical protein
MGEEVGGRKKFSFAIDGVAGTLRALRDNDVVTAVTFGDTVAVLADGPKKDVVEALAGKLRGVVPSGPTDPDRAFAQVIDVLGENTIVILLTDGEIPKLDVPGWGAAVGRTKAKVTLVAPRDASTRTLANLAAATGATWLATDAAAAWPRLLRQAVDAPLVGKARGDAVRWRGEGGASGQTRAWIETWAKPGARLVAEGEGLPPGSGQPLAAVWRQGLGQVAAVSFGGAGDKDGGHGAGDAAGDVVARLVKAVTPAAGDRRFVVSAERAGGTGGGAGRTGGAAGGGRRIVARGRDGDGFVNGLTLRALILGAGTAEIDLEQVGPGEYAGAVPDSVRGAFVAIVRRDGEGGGEVVGRVSPAEVAGGEWPALAPRGEAPPGIERVDVGGADVWNPRQAAVTWEAGPWPALVAGVVLVAALWARRGNSP